MKELGFGKDYLYSHDNPNNNQEFLPQEVKGQVFYKPNNNTKENSFRTLLQSIWKGKYKY